MEPNQCFGSNRQFPPLFNWMATAAPSQPGRAHKPKSSPEDSDDVEKAERILAALPQIYHSQDEVLKALWIVREHFFTQLRQGQTLYPIDKLHWLAQNILKTTALSNIHRKAQKFQNTLKKMKPYAEILRRLMADQDISATVLDRNDPENMVPSYFVSSFDTYRRVFKPKKMEFLRSLLRLSIRLRNKTFICENLKFLADLILVACLPDTIVKRNGFHGFSFLYWLKKQFFYDLGDERFERYVQFEKSYAQLMFIKFPQHDYLLIPCLGNRSTCAIDISIRLFSTDKSKTNSCIDDRSNLSSLGKPIPYFYSFDILYSPIEILNPQPKNPFEKSPAYEPQNSHSYITSGNEIDLYLK